MDVFKKEWGDEPPFPTTTPAAVHQPENPLRKRIVTRYTPDQEGKNIRDEDVVRPSNHRWCYQGGKETATWKSKSVGRCPTYGSCMYCLKSGPLGRFCQDCEDNGLGFQSGYRILRNQEKLLDSITIAEMFNPGHHETAKADRFYNPAIVHYESFKETQMTLAAERKYRHIKDPAAKREQICQMRDTFYTMLE